MIELDRSNCDWTATDRVAQCPRTIGDSDQDRAKRARETNPPADGAGSADWELIAVLSFVVLNFAALAFAIYFIWAKCGPSEAFPR
jgi:hypothetical protein